MNWFRRVLGGRETTTTSGPVTLDIDRRKEQLARLETALDALVAQLRERDDLIVTPGWKERVSEYQHASGEAMRRRATGAFTRAELLDLVFEIRPVYTGAPPHGLEHVGPLQDEVLAAADELREVLPSERG